MKWINNLRREFRFIRRVRDETSIQVLLLMHLRWLAMLGQLICVFFGLKYGVIEPQYIKYFCAVIGLLGIFNFITVQRLLRRHRFSPLDVFLQLLLDFSAMCFLLFFSGGLWNPLSSIVCLHAVLGAWFSKKQAASLAFFGFFCLGLFLLGKVPEVPPALTDGLATRNLLYLSHGIVAFSLWMVTRATLKNLNSLQQRISTFTEQKNRMDNLRAIGALTAGFAHEFATPLNTARMRLERLSHKSPGNDDALIALEALAQCEQVLRSLTETRLMNPSALSLSPVGLKVLLEEILESWQAERPAQKIRLDLQIPNSTRVLLPKLAFTQTILSLLDNASSANPTGEITFRVNEKDERIALLLEDTGLGFPEIVLERIGEPFLTTKESGTGLGLYNSLTLVQALGGSFKIENLDLGGARVTLLLPPHVETQR